MNIGEAAEAFKDDGGIFITIGLNDPLTCIKFDASDYAKGQGIKGLKNLASNGYYINDASSRENLNADILYSFCDGNLVCEFTLKNWRIMRIQSNSKEIEV